MAKAMTTTTNTSKPGRQGGFSLIELLVAAAILAIGILGLAMLQAMAMRASRGSTNMATAALIAEQVMDQADMEGRLSWLNITSSNRINPTLADLNGLRYLLIRQGEKLDEVMNIRGGVVVPGDPDPTISMPFFRISTRRTAVPGSTVGQMSDLAVRVEFTESVDNNNVASVRTFNLTRRIIHG